jgi:Pyruvate/2-oxoacid:ferredoxin oxidoreductase delta subunit
MAIRRLVHVDEGGPLETVRALLLSLWQEAELQGMFAPIRSSNKAAPTPQLATAAEALQQADPFAPVMKHNAAGEALKTLQSRPTERLAFFLRPCELRSLREIAERKAIELTHALLISSDCLAVFPKEDFAWRAQSIDDPVELTRQSLQFSAQGGILPSRYQTSCQLCEKPYPQDVDVHFELLGLSTDIQFIVGLGDETLAERWRSLMASSETVPSEISQRRSRTLENLSSWRSRSIAFTNAHISQDHESITGLINHLVSCSDCRDRLREHCPLFDEQWLEQKPPQARQAVHDWLASCAGCGMCEYQCPRAYPLYLVIAHLKRKQTASTVST